MSSLHVFFSSYAQSDGFGKCIFLSLLLTSMLSWALIAYKMWELKKAQVSKQWLSSRRSAIRSSILSVQLPKIPNPYSKLYANIQSAAKAILRKNEQRGQGFLTKADIDSIAHSSAFTINNEVRRLGSYLFVLGVIVTLAPFMGLLGTVWGILLSLSELQAASGSMREVVLSGLATALATTVLGLIIAIPAVVGNSFLREGLREVEHDMEREWTGLIEALELQYRKESGHALA